MTAKKPVLIIDDEPDLLDLLCMSLEEEGVEVIRAASGEDGLDLFEQIGPDLVITDQNLPKKNGDEILKEIKAAAPQTKVIIMSGGFSPPGFDGVIQKPIDFDAFVEAVKAYRRV